MPRRTGIALLLVTGLLALMATLGVAFTTLARLERAASLQRMQATRAALLARSGLEDAAARLCAGQDPSGASGGYAGEDWDANGTLSTFEAAQEVFHRTGAGSAPDRAACPVEHALRPSFHARAASLPALARIEGRDRGYSLRLSDGECALKIEDESGKIDVNGGLLDAQDRDFDGILDHRDPDVRGPGADPTDTGRGWNFQLRRILDLLGADPEVGVATLGLRTLQNRPPGGYASVKALEAALGTSVDLSPFLTARAWDDPAVLHPNGYPSQPAQNSLSNVRRTRREPALEEGGRPPVNLNAAPLPVLRALLTGLCGATWHACDRPVAYTVTAVQASGIAQAIAVRRASAPFRDWPEVWAFLDGLVPSVITGHSVPVAGPGLVSVPHGGNLSVADLLKANLDPNSALNKHSPDQLAKRWVDKSDLMVWSTEGALEPTGTFRISSVGRVTDARGRLQALRTASADVEAFRLLRQTSQADFVAGRADPADYLSLASAPFRTNGASTAWAAGRGLGLMTYPCALPALPGNAAAYDGALQLCTNEFRRTSPPGGTLRFLHHFDAGWNAYVGSPKERQTGLAGLGDAALQTDVTQGVWPAPPAAPSTLLPDGIQVQPGCAPAFLAAPNLPPDASGDHGAFCCWIKRSPGRQDEWDVSLVRDGGGSMTQALVLGRSAGETAWGILAETGSAWEDVRHERDSSVFVPVDEMPGGRWHLMLGCFDTDHLVAGEDMQAELRSVHTDTLVDPWPLYPMSYLPGVEKLAPALEVFVVGPVAANPFSPAQDQGQVVDELALADFGDDPTTALPLASAWAQDLYLDGRYYKGDDGAYLSPELKSGGRILGARWTAYLPSESRQTIPGTMSPPVTGTPRLLDPTLRDPVSGRSYLTVELDLLGPGDSLASPVVEPLDPARPLCRDMTSFRYRARFRNLVPPAEIDNCPMLESPILDDVTFLVQRAEGPRVLSWESPR